MEKDFESNLSLLNDIVRTKIILHIVFYFERWLITISKRDEIIGFVAEK